ncbi:MAG: thermonuclease family protein [Oligoflexus sp.]
MLVRMSMVIWLAFFSANFTYLNAADCAHTETSFACAEYVKNYDGDTITFNIRGLHPLLGENISVRVKGIDTPELRTSDNCEQRLGVHARNYVSATLLRANRIELMNIERDKYFRVLANVRVNGRYLERSLLGQGLAVPYDGGTKLKVDWCALLADYEGSL